MTKDTLIDEARALKEKFENAALKFLETYKPDYPYDQITVMADFARQVAADAVRERDEMLGDTLRRFLEEHCYTLSEDPLLYQFAAEMSALKQEAQTDER